MRGALSQLCALCVLCGYSLSARADADRAVAVGASILPGAIVHGSGSWVAGDRRAAKRLALAELAGLGLAALGGLPVGISGGAPETLPGLALAIPGAGLFLTSWFADLYGAAGGAALGGHARGAPARAEVGVGYLVVSDARAGSTHAATLAATAWLDRGRASIAAWSGAGAHELGGALAVRVLGGIPGRRASGGTALDVVLGGHDRRFSDDGTRSTTLELGVDSRLDLERVAPSLAGSFVTGGLGAGHEWRGFDAAPDDGGSLLLATFGFGVYLGGDAEVELFYDHRRDGLAGRLVLDSGINGFFGHAGLRGAAHRGRWGVAGGVEVGAAWVAQLAVTARLGADR